LRGPINLSQVQAIKTPAEFIGYQNCVQTVVVVNIPKNGHLNVVAPVLMEEVEGEGKEEGGPSG
jgi:hypothetical protein